MTNRFEERLLILLRYMRRRAYEAQTPLELIDATISIERLAAGMVRAIRLRRGLSPAVLARQATPWWIERLRQFDALEIHPCCVVGTTLFGEEAVETCEPAEADFWTVYGHYALPGRRRGIDALRDFSTEAEAAAFRDRIRAGYGHLA